MVKDANVFEQGRSKVYRKEIPAGYNFILYSKENTQVELFNFVFVIYNGDCYLKFEHFLSIVSTTKAEGRYCDVQPLVVFWFGESSCFRVLRDFILSPFG